MIASQLTFFGKSKKPSTLESRIELPTEQESLDWKRIARIVLPRFSELHLGEHIGRKEIERRLRELKKTGFPVENYGRMSQSEMFNYLIHDIRPYVYRMSGKYCSEVVSEIRNRNKRSQRDVYLVR